MPKYYEKPQYSSQFQFRLLKNNQKIHVRPHYHRDIEIILVLEGTITIMVEDEQYSIKKNNFCLIPTKQIHFLFENDEQTHLVYQFSTDLFQNKELRQTFVLSTIDRPILSATLALKTQTELIRILMDIYSEWTQELAGSFIAIAGLLDLFLLELGRAGNRFDSDGELQETRRHTGNLSQAVLKAIEYIDNFYFEDLDLDRISKEVNLSKFHFSRLFKSDTGMTINDYLNEVRMNRAKFLLINTEQTVEEISVHVGFEYIQNFYRMFKKYVGETPKQYKNRHITSK